LKAAKAAGIENPVIEVDGIKISAANPTVEDEFVRYWNARQAKGTKPRP
jgi:hypothetical protein